MVIELILIGFLGGLVTGISPCILPVVPVIFAAGAASGLPEEESMPATAAAAHAELVGATSSRSHPGAVTTLPAVPGSEDETVPGAEAPTLRVSPGWRPSLPTAAGAGGLTPWSAGW